MSQRKQQDVEILERGNIYFAYRPKVAVDEAHEFDDVQRSYIILSPEGKDHLARINIGKKRLPDISGGERVWGFVEQVAQTPEEITAELGSQVAGREAPPVARPAGEGVYAIARHQGHTHLAYALELPEEPGEAQHALQIEKEGSYILTIKNPDKAAPRRAGLSEERQASYPEALQERFQNRRFIEADPPDFLAYEGAELILIGAGEDTPRELGIELHPERETEASAEIFRELHLNQQEHPTTSLFKGAWA